MPAPGDLVHQTSITTGTGAQTLVAVLGKRSFLSWFGTGGTNTFDYYISHRTAAEHERGTGHESGGTLVRDTVLANHLGTTALVNFSAGIKDITNGVPAGKIVHTDLAQTLIGPKTLDNAILTGVPVAPTAAETVNTTQIATTAHVKDYAAPFSALATNNIIYNGCGIINQENGDAYLGVNWINYGGYFMDGWLVSSSIATPGSAQLRLGHLAASGSPLPAFGGGIWTDTQVAGVPSPGANDRIKIYQPIEYSRLKCLGMGRAGASSVTLSFWVYCTITGTMCVSLASAGTGSRIYIQEVVIAAATTWQYVTLTFPPDTTSPTSWDVADNASGGYLQFCFTAGASQNDATAGSWQTWGDDATAAQTNFLAGLNVVLLTGIVLLPGTEAPSQAMSPLLQRSYGDELLQCQRYYIRLPYIVEPFSDWDIKPYPTTLRAAPTLAPVPPPAGSTVAFNGNMGGAFYTSGARAYADLVADARLL